MDFESPAKKTLGGDEGVPVTVGALVDALSELPRDALVNAAEGAGGAGELWVEKDDDWLLEVSFWS